MTTTTYDTRDDVENLAYANGWVLFRDLGWSREYHRATLDENAKEKLSVYFSESKTHFITGASYVYPTGDRFATTGKPVTSSDGLTGRDKDKLGTVSYWLTHKLYAQRGINELLAKMNLAPVLEERWSLADYTPAKEG